MATAKDSASLGHTSGTMHGQEEGREWSSKEGTSKDEPVVPRSFNDTSYYHPHTLKYIYKQTNNGRPGGCEFASAHLVLHTTMASYGL